MEALAALGLAGNVLQFLDFGGALIKGTLECYQKADGATSVNAVLESITKDLTQLCAGMNATITCNVNETDAALVQLSKMCQSLGQEFLSKLADLKVKGRRKGWQSLRQALRAAWKAKEIQRYERQLETYRSQITLRLLTALMYRQKQNQSSHRQAICPRNESRVAQVLDNLDADHRRLGICTINEAAELRRRIVKALEEISPQSGTPVLETHNQRNITNETADNTTNPLANVPSWLAQMSSSSALLIRQMSVIDGLQFPRISEREQNIHEAHPTTFEWLFEAKNSASNPSAGSGILEWLQSGSGIFWVSGKAGSGKSTLMKFFHQNKRTISALQTWAGTRKLLMARYFFWNAGTPMQKSQQGLLQTLLYHVLRQDPTLIPSVCPHRWSRENLTLEEWSHAEVVQAFKSLSQYPLESARLCFFIDGLDEFEGDHLDIIKAIAELTSSDAIKVCLSSRPWAVFARAYGSNPQSMIRLQDLTRGDITRFVRDRLAEKTHFVTLRDTDEAYENLVQEILERSDGVFLWVFLVVKSLRRGMTNLDTVKELQRRLRQLPSELEVFFRHILDSVEKVYHEHAARLYLVRLVAAKAPPVADLSMFDEENLDFGLDDSLVQLYRPYHPSLLENLKTRIMARCQDLLEFDHSSELQFLHRTVRDFLVTKDIQALLHERAGQEFNPHHFICNSMLFEMRLAARFRGSLQLFTSRMKTFWYHSREMEVNNVLDYRLFPMFDRTVWTFRSTVAWEIRDFHYAGWLADAAVENGLESFLLRNPHSRLNVLNNKGYTVCKPRLDIVLRDMRSCRRLEMVERLLDAGADPNEIIQTKACYPRTDLSIWESYIKGLDERAPAFEEDIIAMLLLRGANPNIGDPDEDFFKNCLTFAHVQEEEIDHLEELRLSLIKQQQHTTSNAEVVSGQTAMRQCILEKVNSESCKG